MNWSGRTVAICASGPSLDDGTVASIRRTGMTMIAINDTWRKFTGADVLLAADGAWWKTKGPNADEFRGERICCDKGVDGTGFLQARISPGGNGAVHAACLAKDRGASRLLLFFVDLNDSELTHWHGPHPHGLRNPSKSDFEHQRKAWGEFERSTPDMEVINCNLRSGLHRFPKMDPLEALLMYAEPLAA